MGTLKHHSTIKSAYYGIKWAHNTTGLSDPCEADIVRSIVEASKRELNRPIKKKELLTADLMKLLFLIFNTVNRTLKELRLSVICVLSYTGFLRYDELSNIKANDITFHEEYPDMFIEKSKTDCYRNSKNVLIARLNTPQCPVTILQCYIREAKIDLSTDKYIFRPLIYFKRNKNYMMRNSNIKLSYTRAREIIREALSPIGINMNNYGLHSLRSGRASAAYKCDVPDRLCKVHGRWKSEHAKDGYVCEDLEKRLSVSENLGI
jgi:hypothetical protein